MNDATPAHVGLLRGAGGDWRESSALPSVLLTFTRDLNIHREPFHSHGSILMWPEELGRWLPEQADQKLQSRCRINCFKSLVREVNEWIKRLPIFSSMLSPLLWVSGVLTVMRPHCGEPTWNLVPVSHRLFYGQFCNLRNILVYIPRLSSRIYNANYTSTTCHLLKSTEI